MVSGQGQAWEAWGLVVLLHEELEKVLQWFL